MKKNLLLLMLIFTISQPSLAFVNYYCESDLDGHAAEKGESRGFNFNDGGLIVDKMEGYCSKDSEVFRFSSYGGGASMRLGSFQFMSLTCLNDNVTGKYYGVSFSIGAALNVNGATFAKSGLSNVCDLSGIGNGVGASLTVNKFVIDRVDCTNQENFKNIRFCQK